VSAPGVQDGTAANRQPGTAAPTASATATPPGPVSELFSGSAIVFVGLAARIGLLMLFELVAARHLGPASYGLFSLAFTWITVVAFLPVLGLQSSVRRFISLHLERRQLAEVRGLLAVGLIWPALSGLVLGGLLFAFASRLALAFDKPELAPLIRALALVVPLWSTRKLATSIFSGYKRPVLKAVVEDFTEPGLRLVGVVAIAAAGRGVLTLAWATTAAYLVVGVLALLFVGAIARQAGAALGSERIRVPWRELAAFSTPLFVSELGDLVLAWVSVLLLGALSVEREVGLFRSVSQPPMLAGAIITSFGFVYLPTATELYARGDLEGWRRANRAVARWTLTLAFPVAVICLFYPTAVIDVLFGAAYRDGATAMRILAFAYLFRAGCGMTGLNLIAAGHTRLHMGGTLLAVVLIVGLSAAWIPAHGATGAAWAFTLATCSRTLFNLITNAGLIRLLPFDARWLGLGGTLLASLGLLAAAARALDLPPIVAMFVVGGLVLPLAVGLGLATGTVRRADVDVIARLREGRSRPHGE
jgi:O-antigen/teichoic acid export membrane protein